MLIRIRRFTLLLLFSVFAVFHAAAQSDYYTNYGLSNGLPSSQVYHMYQDVNGLLWFATDNGICSYDGYEFKPYDLTDGLTSTTVFRFYPQANGEIWCSTPNNAFFYFNPNDYKIKQYEFNNVSSIYGIEGIVNDMYLNDEGTLSVGYQDRVGVLSISSEGELLSYPRKKKIYEEDICELVDIKIHHISDSLKFTFLQSSENEQKVDLLGSSEVKIKNSAGMYYKMEAANGYCVIGEYKKYTSDVYLMKNGVELLSFNTDERPLGVGFYDDNHFWVGYLHGGVIIYDFQGNEVKRYLENSSVTRVLEDHQGGKWFSTLYSGVYYSGNIELNHLTIDGSNIYDLCVNDGEGMMLGTLDGEYFKVVSGIPYATKYSKTKAQMSSPALAQYYNKLEGLVVSNNNNVWIGDRIIIKDEYFTNLSDDIDELPIATRKALICVIKKDGSYTKYHTLGNVYDACITDNGIYFTKRYGLYFYDTVTRTEHKIDHEYHNYPIMDIDKISDSKFVLATNGNGVVIRDGKKVQRISTEDGLSSDIVFEVYHDQNGDIWAGTNKGINRIRINAMGEIQIDVLGHQDGLIDNYVNDIKLVDDTLWIATASGVTYASVNYLFKDSWKKSFLSILRFKVNTDTVESLSNLSYWQNSLEIDFRALSFKVGSKIIYRYKMDGLDKDWKYTYEQSIAYNALPPGEYTFIVQAGMNDSWEDEVKRIPISISPAFYSTIWFKSSSVLLILFLVYLFFKYRILSYNKHISRELMRHILKRLRRKSYDFIVQENRKEIKINSQDVFYVKSADNYVEIYTTNGKVVIREKISNFLNIVPDEIEYLQVRRNYIVRIDKITSKSKNSITVHNLEIKIGETYKETFNQIHLS
ncbi:MAG: triple tyrosine motif-containing protein [Crocinitomicaceae bacterium]|nr:triple tyrosine motif-containing protein [Crocinitomicaceae bacterium]